MAKFGRDLTQLSTRSLANAQTGMDGEADHLAQSQFQDIQFNQRQPLDRFYRNSWLIRDLIDIPVNDMFSRWREFEGAQAEQMREAEVRFDVRRRLGDAIKAGRRYGTGLLVMVTYDAPLEEPLRVEALRDNDLSHLYVADRFNAEVAEVEVDFNDSQYGRPLRYRLDLPNGNRVIVHASRVLRFDGIPPLNRNQYGGYAGNEAWGRSIIAYAIDAAKTESSLTQSVGHLAQEMSMTTMKIADFHDIIAERGISGRVDKSPSILDNVRQVARTKSNYRIQVIDADSDLTRVEVRWNGLPQVQQQVNVQLAAIADMPATRLMGQSPLGMNATGESDLVNYAMTIQAQQEQLLTEPLMRLDEVLARVSGLGMPPDYQFLSLLDISEQDNANAASTWATALATLTRDAIMDEDEARDVLRETGLFGDLPGPAPMPELEPDEVIETVAVSEGNDAN